MRNLEMAGRSTVHATHGMAATSHPLATQTAISVLQAGGNAMDAAIAACAVQCVVEPQSTGIGGDCFCLYAPGDGGDVVAFNGSGKAPMAATPEWYADHGIAKIERQTAHAVTIPGAIDAWDQLLRDHGTLGLNDLLLPAISYARDGYPIHHRVNFDWNLYVDLLAADPTAARIFLKDGKAPAIGTLHRQPEMAQTLELIAREGRDPFYKGVIASDIVDFLQSLGGLHTMDDFATYQGEYVTPIKTTYRGHDVYECPPNGQGVAALALLNILSGFDLGALDPRSAERLHIEIEASRLAYRDRDRVLADPDHTDIPMGQWLSEEHAAANRDRIDRTKRMEPLPASDFPNHDDTVYLTVVDKDRNAVSFINSIFAPFGNGTAAPKTGILLQNRGMAFNLDPAHPNCIAPGKRPLHTIIPGMLVKDGRAVMPFGVMGGQYQASGHARLISNLLDYGMDLQEAIDQPRVFPRNSDGLVEVETSIPEETHAELKAMGHQTVRPERPIGGAQAIWIDWDEGVLRGGSEPRKDGAAAGY